MAGLKFRQFTCVREERPLFEPVSLDILPGDIWQVAGPNGAGKTTLLRAISGLFDNYVGEYLWDNCNISSKGYERSEQLMYLGHHPGVKASLTAAENLRWCIGLRDSAAGDITHALAKVGLSGYEDTPCYQMSAGQQRRVALARLHLISTPIWVLDEPFTAIDKQGVARLEAQINKHAAAGGSTLITSHQPVSCEGLKTLTLNAFTGGNLDCDPTDQQARPVL